MSLASTRSDTGCKHCGNQYTENFKRGYCSPLCYHKARGTRILATLKHDHKFCSTCGRRLKVIEPPTDEQLKQIDGLWSTKALEDGGGFQYRTPNAGIGEITIQADGGERVTTGTICSQCGGTKHNEDFPEQQNRHLLEYGWRIITVLESKEDEHKTELDRATFFEMLYATEDLVFSLGKAAHQ